MNEYQQKTWLDSIIEENKKIKEENHNLKEENKKLKLQIMDANYLEYRRSLNPN